MKFFVTFALLYTAVLSAPILSSRDVADNQPAMSKGVGQVVPFDPSKTPDVSGRDVGDSQPAMSNGAADVIPFDSTRPPDVSGRDVTDNVLAMSSAADMPAKI